MSECVGKECKKAKCKNYKYYRKLVLAITPFAITYGVAGYLGCTWLFLAIVLIPGIVSLIWVGMVIYYRAKGR